jgi:hypothetical protein
MVQTLQAKEITLTHLEEDFGLVQAPTGKLFAEVVLPDLSAIDRGDDLDRVAQILKYLGQQV